MSDYLIHYGVPGMKWGVRKVRASAGSGIRQYKNIRRYGFSQGHAKNVSERLNKISNSERRNYMTKRQNNSFERAKDYWNKRASGMSNSEAGGRNIITRTYDSYRSRPIQQRSIRAGVKAASSVLTKSKKVNDRVDDISRSLGKDYSESKISAGKMVSDTIVETAKTLGIEELEAIMFGHF